MLRSALTGLAFVLTAIGIGCSQSPEETDVADVAELVNETSTGEWIDVLPPQQPSPPPAQVEVIIQPSRRWVLKPKDGLGSMADVRQRAQQVITDDRSPVTNGNFERWVDTGPKEWMGNHTYKNGDPSAQNVTMVESDLDGQWALILVAKGDDLALWQGVKLPVPDGKYVLSVTGYIRNPIPAGVAIRLVYRVGDKYRATEVYPVETDGTWVRLYAEANLPEETDLQAIRLYVTCDGSVTENVIIDGVGVQIVRMTPAPSSGASGPSAD